MRFALSVSFIWLVIYNTTFWERTIAAMWHPGIAATTFLGSLAIVAWLLQAALLLLMPSRTALRIATSFLFVAAAMSSWFCDSYGAVMNKDMMRNVLQTDAGEVSALLNVSFMWHAFALGALPAIAVWRVRLPAMRPLQVFKQRSLAITGFVAVSLACIVAVSSSYAVFFREHKPVRFMLLPLAPVTSLVSVLASQSAHGNGSLRDMTGNVRASATVRPRPLVLFLVIGETARAANFQLGGYARPTNRELMDVRDLVYFSKATSCGTATAVSVPCMFSHLPRTDFDVGDAGRYTNLLDVLEKAGLDVEWRDNNAGCKGVCERIRSINFHDDEFARTCEHNECPDEVMLAGLTERLQAIDRDTVIVFHQMGSHGPAYSRRYPAQSELFDQACRSNQLQRCSVDEILNAYDNTIAYTSQVLARQIELLRAATHLDTALIYVSDHGESLGEQGVYLHGLPYAFAPAEQKNVPLLFWPSPAYLERTELKMTCVRSRAQEPASHDNLYHTVLGVTELRNDFYLPQLDLLSACRFGADSGSHE